MLLGREMKRTIFMLVGRDWFGQEPEMDIHYIGGTEVLPPPLDSDRENQMLEALNGESSEWAKSILIEHNLRLVVYIAKRFDNTGVGVEDLISIGTIGLIKSINTFNPDKNIKLATYASRCIENEILMFLRKSQNKRQDLSIDEPLSADSDGNELLLGDILGSDSDLTTRGMESKAEREELLGCVKRLGDRERQIICLRFGLFGCSEHTQKEVACKIGISQSYISRIEKRVIKKLRREMARLDVL